MKDEYTLYENAGELTRACLDDIIEGNYRFFDDDGNYTEEYLLEYNFKSFAEGLTECIINNGFSGDVNSADEKTAYIKKKCSENNISLNPAVVKTWFITKRPASSKLSRELVYRLCFALGLNAEETTDFFLKVYYECPFNFRLHNELVYFYCLNNRRSYADALDLAKKAEEILKSSEADGAVFEFTSAIGKSVGNIHSDEELLEFISKNSSDLIISNRTAFRYASALLDECTALAAESCRNTEELHHKPGRAGNIDLLIYVLFGEDILGYKKDASFSRAAEFPELVKSNFPLKMHLSNIRNGKKISYETMRKALILLSFYSYYARLFQGADDKFCAIESDFISFTEETNDLLSCCGYPPLYVRNPYDWLIMHCAYCEFPFEEFKDAVSRYYLDAI